MIGRDLFSPTNFKGEDARCLTKFYPVSVTARLSGASTMRRGAAERVESTRVLRSARDSAQGFRQLAGEVQSRTAAAGCPCRKPNSAGKEAESRNVSIL